MSSSRKRKARRAYLASLDAYVPLSERYIDPRVEGVRLYRAEIKRGNTWEPVKKGDFGDLTVAENYAHSLRDNTGVDARVRFRIANGEPAPVRAHVDQLQIVEQRPSSSLAKRMESGKGRPLTKDSKLRIGAGYREYLNRSPGAAVQLGLRALSGGV